MISITKYICINKAGISKLCQNERERWFLNCPYFTYKSLSYTYPSHRIASHRTLQYIYNHNNNIIKYSRLSKLILPLVVAAAVTTIAATAVAATP